MTDDTPTQRIPETDATGELVEERKKSRALLYTLVGVGAALLIAIVVLLIILFGGKGTADPTVTPTASDTPTVSATPSDSPTPTESATPTPTPTPTPDSAPPPPPPPDTSPGFASFSRGASVMCNSTPGPGYVPPGISFNYTATNASSVWFLFGEGDAADAQAFPMPISGNQNDVYGGSTVEYPCGQASAKFTLTVVGTNGQHVNKTFTVTNDGDVY